MSPPRCRDNGHRKDGIIQTVVTRDEIYRKFGEVAEAAQLIEIELGSAQLFLRAVSEGMITPTLEVDSKRAAELLVKINRQTMGQHVRETKQVTDALDQIEPMLTAALKERNRLFHHFYREHNIRINTSAGRAIMLADLEAVHETLTEVYNKLLLMSGIDADELTERINAMPYNAEVAAETDKKVFHLKI
jgi:hypothetical protein